MNKFIKISISFIIFGLVLIGLATYLNNGHIPRFSSNSEKKNYSVSVNDVKNLDIDIIDSDVTIEENTVSKNIEIEYYTALERKVNIEHIGNKLSIKENKNIVGINFNIFSEKRKLIIKIPKPSNIDINSVNKIGDYFIKNLDIKSLIINSKLGDVYITNISASDADIKLATGNLNIDNLNSKNNSLKINVATGNVKLNNINDLKDISVDNKTGDTDLSSSIIKNINITNKLGNIKVSNLLSESSDNINLKTTTGNITLSNLTANNSITLKSTTGDIIAEINDDESNFTNSSNKKKQLFTSSETGTVNVKFSNK
ncbi:DUF4097 family beta strand repeat-containing protein [uncultured Gemella sp.]|jgi:hypothetical protein|uniref:DUF4097 family beta strand repeat-containing protein n=1 Tax=uncultured Gemella sp. TaxID=254352 RepID=UPI00260C3F29|nr:DUF4097 family beta strand repeat-containing protein [uncultured Gemella sp.]MDU6766087.1 DUF4097 family beta strand repeat-containing protein [Gemella haemolysans]